MGVVYKLKQEVINFILEEKKAQPNISCRKLTLKIQEKFQTKVSKSSINKIFKNAGLSMPVGRRIKKRRIRMDIAKPLLLNQLPKEEKCPISIILKSAEYLIGGSDLREVRCFKINLSDNSEVYLDGQLHSVWENREIPFDFSTTYCSAKSYIDKLVLFTAPGYNEPPEAFFNLIKGLTEGDKKLSKITLYNNKLEELENTPFSNSENLGLVFGLWPWQFITCRNIKNFGEFRPYHFAPLSKDFYIAELELSLTQPIAQKQVTLKGFALKKCREDNINLLILGDLHNQADKPEHMVELYLSHWPNIEEGFQDFSHKIELFSYNIESQGVMSLDSTDLAKLDQLELSDSYVRWYFLPKDYRKLDFLATKKRFYDLEADLIPEQSYVLVKFKLPPEYPHLKDLTYACHRMNERQIISPDKKRLWFLV